VDRNQDMLAIGALLLAVGTKEDNCFRVELDGSFVAEGGPMMGSGCPLVNSPPAAGRHVREIRSHVSMHPKDGFTSLATHVRAA
jgi:hypothetical protein